MLNILLTNDDGIHADGLQELYLELKQFANVTIVAPDRERSSCSHAITLKDPIRYKKVQLDKAESGYAVTGTPADCVKLALKVILKSSKPDLIISGINHGTNDGTSVHYSGTVAAAREGALNDYPSISLSLDTFDPVNFKTSAQISAKLIRKLGLKWYSKGVFLNINIPNLPKSKIKGVSVVKQNTKAIHSHFYKKTDQYGHEYFWLGAQPLKGALAQSTDTAVLHNGYVSVAPILIDTTDQNTFEILSTIDFNS